jgi:hypothetical protein
MAVSQFTRDMSAAKSVIIDRVNTRTSHVTNAEVADMSATNNSGANGPHVSTAEATETTAAKIATAACKDGTTGHRYANHRGSGGCENYSVIFHGLAPFPNDKPNVGPEGPSFQYRLALGMIEKIDLLLHQTVGRPQRRTAHVARTILSVSSRRRGSQFVTR